MEQLLLARQLGSMAASRVELHWRTRLFSTLSPFQDPEISFTNTHKTGVNALALETQEGRFMLSGGADGSISLWDLFTAKPYNPELLMPSAASRKHSYGISGICYYPADRGLFVSTSYDRTVRIWDTEELSVACTFALGSTVFQAAMASRASHTLVAAACQSASIRLLDLATGASTHTLVGNGGGGAMLTVAWSPRDENILASGSTDGTIRIWDIRKAASCLAILDTQNEVRPMADWRNRAHQGAVTGLTWSEDGASLLSLGNDEKMRIWDMVNGKNTLTSFDPIIRYRRPHVINPVIIPFRHSDPQLVFVASETEAIGFNMVEGDVRVKLSPTKANINALIACPSPFGLLYGTGDGSIGFIGPCPGHPMHDRALARDGQPRDNEDVLDSIYRSLTEKPTTFT